jgi:hypothetical protein
MLNASSPTNGQACDNLAYGIPSNADQSYFSPTIPTPHNASFNSVYAGDSSADSVYAPNTFGAFPGSPDLSDVSGGRMGSGVASPSQIGGPVSVSFVFFLNEMNAN